MDDLWPAVSLGMQAVTAYMVYQLVASQSSGPAVEEKIVEKTKEVVVTKTEEAKDTVSPDDIRSIRGENVYGPYKKVSFVEQLVTSFTNPVSKSLAIFGES